MYVRTTLVLVLALAATTAWAQKPVERSPLEIGRDYAEAVVADGSGRFVVEATGQPRTLSFLNYAVTPGTPEAMARAYLAAASGVLRLASPALEHLEHLEHTTTRESLAGTTVRFRQTVGGVPVHAPETVVHIDRQNRVQLVMNEYRPEVTVASTTPSVPAEAARQAAFAHLGVEGDLRFDETTLVVYPMAEAARLAWQVRVVADAPHGDWEAFVDAQTGELLRVANRAVYHHAEGGEDPPALAPTVEAARSTSRVDGTGTIFLPDPLTRDGVAYGTPGYVDGNDADTPELNGARTTVTLRDITFDGTNHRLVGPYAEIREIEAPTRGTFEQPSSDWTSTRNPAVFEGANVYYHIDAMMRYINDDLGIALMPDQYVGGVRFDAHALNGSDNSYYSGATGAVHFGEGCVDDSEDADVIVHELGHGLHDWLAGGTPNSDGLSEGTGDYFANSYTRHLGLLTPADPSYYWVFKWDGHNPCWPGRVTNYPVNYPGSGGSHTRGQIWSTALMTIWDEIGGERTDVVVIEGLAMTNAGSQQPQAAQAVLQAAFDLGYSIAERQFIYDTFVAKGYNITMPPPPVASEPEGNLPAAYELSRAYPNPFNPAATFTLRVAEAQQVSVALYDALGRQVQTLFTGPMAADERRTFVIDARELPSGLYVYRVTGETFSASNRVTLVK